ncbi:31628_t:CDS:2 [Racocetra persica]|uniref:31628_t:CDS:1 n=1 Tax=Racocetra persica TaxID=160502 RepID=A0ACA9QEG5_9GLOM|nr:31628_t:CDS:2 [Racocetra persica]
MDFAQIKREVYEAISGKPISKYITNALDVIEESIKKYGVEGLSLSFNGGKDCMVLLHLFAAALFKQFHDSINTLNIQAVYITYPNSFAEVDDFVKECVRNYKIDLVTIEGPIKQALEQRHQKPKEEDDTFEGSNFSATNRFYRTRSTVSDHERNQQETLNQPSHYKPGQRREMATDDIVAERFKKRLRR